MNFDKSMAIEGDALGAMVELIKMARDDRKVLWLQQGHEHGRTKETLNYKEYLHVSSEKKRPPGYKTDATRETAMVFITSLSLVETLMNVNRWQQMFSCMVSRAITFEFVADGLTGSLNGALLRMYAELQVLSALVPTREVYFQRFCMQSDDGVWAVVDLSTDMLTSSSRPFKSRRRPSGCLIQDMHNGYSEVTWVEHWEYDDSGIHRLYRSVINNGLAFGAQRWLATLQRQCERLAIVLSSPQGTIATPAGNGSRNVLMLAEKMSNAFCSMVNASNMHRWTELSSNKDSSVRVTKKNRTDNPGDPPTAVLSAATSIWLPVEPKRLFDFLRDETMRSEWDILSTGGRVQEMAYIATGQDTGNSVSLLKASIQTNTVILQETCRDSSGFLVVYSPVDASEMKSVIDGGDSTHVAILPSGFSILPSEADELHIDQVNMGRGALLTAVIQILVSASNPPTSKITVESLNTVDNLISYSVHKIKSALL